MRSAWGRFRRDLGGRLALVVLAVVVLIVGVLTSYVQMEPDEVGVVLRLGRFVGIVEPGPHVRLPFGIERITKVPVQRQLKAEFGLRTQRSDVRTTYAADKPELAGESLMLTGDLNVAVVEWIVQYKIRDPYQYLFKVKNVQSMLRDISEASMRAVVGELLRERGAHDRTPAGRDRGERGCSRASPTATRPGRHPAGRGRAARDGIDSLLVLRGRADATLAAMGGPAKKRFALLLSAVSKSYRSSPVASERLLALVIGEIGAREVQDPAEETAIASELEWLRRAADGRHRLPLDWPIEPLRREVVNAIAHDEWG